MSQVELSDMIRLAERLLAVGEVPVLATLFCSSGSTYRQLGAMMVSGPGGISAGGVSGGCVEEYVARHGRTIVQTQPATMLSFDADPDGDGGKPSLGCGGSIEVLVERLTNDHLNLLRKIREARQSDARHAVACVVETFEASDIRVSWQWPTHGVFREPELDRLRLQAIEITQGRHGMLDSRRRVLVQYLPAITRLIILGAGDDARPLCTLAHSLGWHVTIADRRTRLATGQRFADADDVIAGDWETAINAIHFSPRTAVVMMTHSLSDDIELLPQLADKPAAYLGALGPEHRRQWLIDGAQIDENLAARLRGPIGLNLGDRSPTGIAVSIVAEILAELNGRDAARLSTANKHKDADRHPFSTLTNPAAPGRKLPRSIESRERPKADSRTPSRSAR